MRSQRPARLLPLREIWHTVVPGVAFCGVIAMAASLISQSYGGPLFLYALLLGMAFNSVAVESRLLTGVEFTTRTLLRLGVALLGLRLGLATVVALGWLPLFVVVVGLGSTLCFGLLVARRLGRSPSEGILTSGAVAICGASAAMAISAALPHSADRERLTLLTVLGVTALSTVSMIAYPLLAALLDLKGVEAALLFGGTIHDVAQVVGAAVLYQDAGTGEIAVYVKLLRVAMLAPVVLLVGLWARGARMRSDAGPDGAPEGAPLLPAFLVGFLLLFALANVIEVPPVLLALGTEFSQALILLAVAGLGIKTSLADLGTLGWRPAALLVGNTVFLLGVVLALIFLHRWLAAG
jgi:uncharacterized integral membrane protein (TIGR00698 family)